MPNYSTFKYGSGVLYGESYSAEPLVTSLFKDLIDNNWNSSNCTQPTVVLANQSLRYNLDAGDYIIIRMISPGEAETLKGPYSWYKKQMIALQAEFHSATSRQRLYDLEKEFCRICYANIHSFSDYQKLRYQSFVDHQEQGMNIFKGTARIQVEGNILRAK